VVQTTYARDLSLLDLREQFGLIPATDSFFDQLQADLPALPEDEQQALNRVRGQYEYLIQGRPMSEESVKMVILARLLDLAGFYQDPFEIETETETSIKITAEDDGVEVKGNIDVLVILKRFWVLVIEAKGTKFDVMTALPQALAHMLSAPQPHLPTFGLLVNGREFVFVRLTRPDGQPQYSLSEAFAILQPHHDLCDVLRILKHIGALITGVPVTVN
jgi:hypothetical protein